MKPRYGSGAPTLAHVLIIALGMGTAAGWGLWLVSDYKADQIEADLRRQIATLADSQMKLLHEREVAQATGTDLAALQSQVAPLREEVAALRQSRDQARAELAMVRSNSTKVVEKAAQADLPETGSTAPSKGDPEQVVIASAQRALTKLGYGSLAADGILGPGTRSAIEGFQYKNSLPVTGELDAQTLQRLTGADAVASAE